MEADKKQELVQIQLGPAEQGPPRFWRSLDELNQTESFQRELHREFSAGGGVLDEVSRRGFFKLLGASAAVATMAGCTKLPIEAIVPYVVQPEEIIPGKPLFFATNMEYGGYAQAILARSNEGRPTKIEGNPEHPISLGATDVFTQGALYDLYDPYRAENNYYGGEVRPWPDFIGAMQAPITSQKANGGAGLRVLTQAVGSPTLGAQLRTMAQDFPKMKWHTWEPVTRDGVRGGSQMAFGQQVETVYNLENADVIVALDADFLMGGFPGFTLYARQYASRRNPDDPRGMARMYSIESTPSVTGYKADHRIAVKAADIEQYARALAGRLGVGGGGGQINNDHAAWLDALAKDLQAHRGAAIVIPGEYQPASVHALCHAINDALGAQGKTVNYTEPVLENPVDMVASIRELVADMNAGQVEVLLILGGNPVFDAPGDLGFKDALNKVGLRIHHNLYRNETTDLCQWFVGGTHFLEEWSDSRAVNGMVSIRQPLIAPLYGGHSAHQVLAIFNGQPDVSDYDLVRAFWKSQYTGADFEDFWRRSVHDGFLRGSEFKVKTVKANAGAAPAAAAQNSGGLEIIFRHDPSIFDGRWADNAWLQECPKPLTKLTWENVVLLSPATAKKLLGFDGGQHTKIVTLTYRNRKVDAPVWVQAGHPDDSVTVYFGYGRVHSGRTGTGKGFDAYQLRFSDAPFFGSGAKLEDTGRMYDVASTQGYQLLDTQNLDGRHVIRAAPYEEYKKDPEFAHKKTEAPGYDETLYPNYFYPSKSNSGNPEKQWERHGAAGYRWGMSIDLNSCVGCNACIIACQAENNIAVVGKEQVLRGRHMHWLRVDIYYEGDPANPRAYFEPLPCMQCEDAPCELVCPVGATVHSTEGLNDMVYNRCVGTRYCSNNCPWKVRRFNFLLFSDAAWSNPSLKMLQNPEVTVRSRGVMEKCTYCVQRITKARITAEEQDRRVRDGEILTACQEVCPSNAIVFGDLDDPDSKVNKLKVSQRNFGVLEELNTRPRTTYLAAVLNPNPAMPQLAAQQQPEHNY